MKLWKNIALGAAVVLASIQLLTCAQTNPKVNADLRAATDVKAVLVRACYDCHSNETAWPWYTHVAPVSWLVHHDVYDGRAALNFSDWEALPADRRAKLQKETGEEVAEGEMPPPIYTPLHPRAALSNADKQLIQAWVHRVDEPRAQTERGDP